MKNLLLSTVFILCMVSCTREANTPTTPVQPPTVDTKTSVPAPTVEATPTETTTTH